MWPFRKYRLTWHLLVNWWSFHRLKRDTRIRVSVFVHFFHYPELGAYAPSLKIRIQFSSPLNLLVTSLYIISKFRERCFLTFLVWFILLALSISVNQSRKFSYCLLRSSACMYVRGKHTCQVFVNELMKFFTYNLLHIILIQIMILIFLHLI